MSRAALASVVVALAGCADPGPLHAPRALIDPTALTATPASAGGARANAVAPDWPAERWWQAIGDPALDALIERALNDQPSLQVALARAQRAAAQVAAVSAGSPPEATDQRFSAKGLVPPTLAGATRWNSSLQLGGRWELDLFGRRSAALGAARQPGRSTVGPERRAGAGRHAAGADRRHAHRTAPGRRARRRRGA